MKKDDRKGMGASAPPSSPGPAQTDSVSFEAAMTRLEEIVEALEGGELALDDSLKLFEEGVGLSRRAGELLAQAERKVEVLTRAADGTLATEPLADDADEDEA